MTQNTCVFHLKVQRIEQACLFELSWGRGQQLMVMVPYPEILSTLYQEWKSVYLSFYKTALRGRVAVTGSIASPSIDWHAKLVQAEAKLLYEFHHWLRHSELYEIRSCLAQAVREAEVDSAGHGERGEVAHCVEVFLCCNPLELARLPWEAWEIGAEFAATGKIHFFRTPMNREGATVTSQRRHRRARILAILGDDTGLNFKADKEAVRSLTSIAEIEFVGWQPKQDIDSLKELIVNAIEDEQGWDVLFFAGHSNETDLTGGELAIAPGVTLHLSEIAQSLTIAKERGLQFALFNSCNGLSIANELINLGLSQVAVMREPIHNRVAQEFLVRFLQRLADYKDVYEALLTSCQYLKLEKHLTYPSAYLIPSLFRHPGAPLFRIKPFGLKQQLKRWLPTKKEAIALAALALVSWQVPVQGFLLERRILMQAIYRQLTHQVPTTKKPPVLLVEIDDESIKRRGISDPRPMDRSYLAALVNKLSAMNAKVVGVDYLLDRPAKDDEKDQKLAKALRSSVQQQGTWFVFACKRKDTNQWFEVMPKLAHPNWSSQGDMLLLGNEQRYMMLAPWQESDSRRFPFAYRLALAYKLRFQQSGQPPQPQLKPSVGSLSQIKAFTDAPGKDYKVFFSPKARVHPLTNFSYQLHQMWLHPILDFSIPPEDVYQRLPAWQLLESPPYSLQLDRNRQPVVMIAPGGYDEAGISKPGEDNFPVPAAVDYWRDRQHPPDQRRVFPGGEAHAYMVQHFLTQRLVVPIPDLWLVGIAALLGKGTALALEKGKGQRAKGKDKIGLFLLSSGTNNWFVLPSCATAIYGLASLQLYITIATLLPWSLPVATFWTFVVLAHLEKKFHA